MTYEIRISEKLEKALRKIPKRTRHRLIQQIDALADTPRPKGSKKLQGNQRPPLYRIRCGDYRIIYTIQDDVLVVLIVEVGHRREVYL